MKVTFSTGPLRWATVIRAGEIPIAESKIPLAGLCGTQQKQLAIESKLLYTGFRR
jgi:hypothetical protein